MPLKPTYAYIAFDLFPSQKGAATHIEHCLVALQNTFNCGILICLGNDDMPSVQYDNERNLFVYRFQEKIVNFLNRTQKFQEYIHEVLSLSANNEINLCHFRDIWGGTSALSLKNNFKTVFEVNSFASIELPNRYPSITPNALTKIKALESFCIEKSDVIITPSEITKKYILNTFSTSEETIRVIPNGVSVLSEINSTKELGKYILYFGALQKWQGIKNLFKAMKEISDLDIKLVICSSVPEKRTQIYQELAKNYGVAHQLIWFYELDKKQLSEKITDAIFTVAPLTACDRNLVQGCNPLKILESMAYGVPVLATHLPVVNEIITENVNGFLVAPDRPEIFGRKMRSLLNNRKKLQEIGVNAKKLIKENYLWEYQESKMKLVYQNLIDG